MWKFVTRPQILTSLGISRRYINLKVAICWAQPGKRANLNRIHGVIQMPKVAINTPAPDFTLTDHNGQPVSLSDYRNQSNVLLVFNRGFL